MRNKQRIHLGLSAALAGPRQLLVCHMRRQKVKKILGEALQQRTAAKADPGRMRREQMSSVNEGEALDIVLFQGHVSNDPDAQSQPDISLDDIGVLSRNRHVRL